VAAVPGELASRIAESIMSLATYQHFAIESKLVESYFGLARGAAIRLTVSRFGSKSEAIYHLPGSLCARWMKKGCRMTVK
jgi:hypothetical protein